MCQIPPNHRFSFSQISLYDSCPMAFKLKYIDKLPDEGNFFSDYGTFGHKLLEEWAKGETPDILLADEYADRYDEAVVHPCPPFPKGMGAKYYEAGLDYFANFSGFGDQYEVLDVEQRFEFPFEVRGNPYSFVGVVDLVLRDKDTGEIVIIDHKSKSARQMKKDLNEYRRQLYTYARFVHDKYGVWPVKIGFNLFKEGGQMVWETFSQDGYDETMKWIHGSVEKILDEKEWKVSASSYFCRQICGVFDYCPAKEAVLYGDEKKD